jgi:tRNA-modifying protein YgfZ
MDNIMTHDSWQQFLSSQGAHWNGEGERVTHFVDNAENSGEEKHIALAGERSILCDLSHYRLIKASGVDSASFLQNQFCNDVRNVSASQSQLNAYCTPKGRVLAFFRLFQREDNYYLRLPSDVLEATLTRLRMFVMMSKVELSDDSDAIKRIGFAGANAGQQLDALCGSAPAQADAVIQHENLTIICIQPERRFEIYGDAAALQNLWQQLSREAMPVGAGTWELLDIHAALPEVYAQTQEAFVPQMLNLQAINALSFKKGCYPGQEIVARMHYLGKLKRRMFVAHTDDDALIQAGDALHAEGSESSQGVGKVVRTQSNPNGGSDLLAVIEISSSEERTLHLHDGSGPLLKLLELPYSIEEAQ